MAKRNVSLFHEIIYKKIIPQINNFFCVYFNLSFSYLFFSFGKCERVREIEKKGNLIMSNNFALFSWQLDADLLTNHFSCVHIGHQFLFLMWRRKNFYVTPNKQFQLFLPSSSRNNKESSFIERDIKIFFFCFENVLIYLELFFFLLLLSFKLKFYFNSFFFFFLYHHHHL